MCVLVLNLNLDFTFLPCLGEPANFAAIFTNIFILQVPSSNHISPQPLKKTSTLGRSVTIRQCVHQRKKPKFTLTGVKPMICVLRLAGEFVSEVGASIRVRSRSWKNIWNNLYVDSLVSPLLLLLFFFRCLPPYNFDAYLCAPWVYSINYLCQYISR